ncbi:membrane-bound metal-dependent hydrolase [Haloterrigena turkmenica DSM 5511]|uniref:Membrane-bound metal-dependent hydrolase n=1 Tax=Haloterrigena turkmenica (strain ATCC 51198 / DSM 5511 / JCM 9101 / NCIMB 13204 / VKM B-1734 / 4k) TaxID=543526 RepID=D2RQK6_HALTV|nr:metal-dependent hydrolase [Haloterrigena turkmenica]ADB62383.1 membrane-bound metal-dependent hydrolase [Haloterrigena turkmenica DSM 5511]
MYRGGHIGFNALLYAPFVPMVSRGWSLEVALLGAALAVGLANLPDIDQPLPRIAHRGPTHTIWFALVVGLCAGVTTALAVPATPSGFWFGFVVGTGSIVAHLAGDIVTPMGISPFAPVSRYHVTLDWFKSKNGRINRAFLLVGSTALLASLGLTIGRVGTVAPVG